MTFILALLALAAFALFDYAGYNTIGQRALKTYRILQTAFGAWLMYMLWCVFGNLAAAFTAALLWWTFNADILYYQYCRWLHWFKNEPVNAFQVDVMGDKVIWAWWTPAGILSGRLKNRSMPINGAVLVIQAFAGIALAIMYQILLIW